MMKKTQWLVHGDEPPPPITGHRNTEITDNSSVHSVLQWLKKRGD